MCEDRLNEVHGSMNSVLKGSRWGMWIFDMAASWHICSRKSAFDRYIDLNHYSDMEKRLLQQEFVFIVWILTQFGFSLVSVLFRRVTVLLYYL